MENPFENRNPVLYVSLERETVCFVGDDGRMVTMRITGEHHVIILESRANPEKKETEKDEDERQKQDKLKTTVVGTEMGIVTIF